MPNQRADGRVVSSFSVDRALLEAARSKAQRDETTLSHVISAALAKYVED